MSVIRRLYQVVNALAKKPQTVTELIEETGIPSVSIYRIIKGLLKEKYIEKQEDNIYALTTEGRMVYTPHLEA